MHPDYDHSPDEHGLTLSRPLRPYTPPRHPEVISRRRFLRGTGVLMALPFFDSLPAWGAESAPAASAVANPPRPFPQRFAAIFQGNGINSKHWWAKGTGDESVFGRTLEPLTPL